MTLLPALEAYVTLRRALGAEFTTAAKVLRSFGRALGDIPLESIQAQQCAAFCRGSGPRTRFQVEKHATLHVFFRYLVARGHFLSSPLPEAPPRMRSNFLPHIYTADELRRLLDSTTAVCPRRGRLQATTLRTLLLLLYGTGLRIGEALSLRECDVDLHERVLSVRDAKFFKSRLVPIGAALGTALAQYRSSRRRLGLPDGSRSTFFAFRSGKAVSYSAVRAAFARLRERAEIRQPTSAQWQPRLHDLRATFAVHRLIAWYREGADVQVRLPYLATYLGHASIAGTQVYLTMTPELLAEASLRFESYAALRKEEDDV